MPLGTGGRGGVGEVAAAGGLGFASVGDGVCAVGKLPGEASRDTVREADWLVGWVPEAHPANAATSIATASGSHNPRNITVGCYRHQPGSTGGVGNTGKDPVRFSSLIGDVSTKIFDRLPDEVWFCPGHGMDSTLGAERPGLPEWRARGW